MSPLTRFNEVLEAIDKLGPEDQEALIGIVERRRIVQRRAELAKEIEEARHEFQAGSCVPRKPTDLMQEILS
jgi:ADP-dependent phosphofructokinase/glucokinase